MNQFLSNKIIAGIVALALLVGVGVLISSGDTSSTTRNAALVVATPCTKPGQVTKVSKQSVVCATTNTGSLWYATMKAKGKAQACTTPGEIRKKSDIVWVCGVVKKKKLWQATQPLPPAVVASITVVEPGASQPTPALDSTQVATPDVPVVADNTVLADPKIPDDKIVTQVIGNATTPITCATGGPCAIGDTGPGGGTIFSVVTGGDGNKKFLEVANAGWNGEASDPVLNWSDTMNKLEAYKGGGHNDWRLPSKSEMDKLCLWAHNSQSESCEAAAVTQLVNGGFSQDYFYWNSDISDNGGWWTQMFADGYQVGLPNSTNAVDNTAGVRPIRSV